MTDKPKLNVGIIGLGPVGMILAVKLQEAGCNVTLCVRNEVRRNKIISEGIVLENVFQQTTPFPDVVKNIKDLADKDLDYLVFAVKSYQVEDTLDEARSLITDRLTVVSAQNGIDVQELLIPAFGDGRVLRMIVNFAGNMIAPNVVKVTFFTPPNYIGSINDARGEQAKKFAEVLNVASLTTHPVDSFEVIRREWEKTILNSSLSALCGVGRLTMAEAMSDPDTLELIEQIIKEAVEVAEQEKIRFPDDFIRQCMRYLKKGGDHFPSLATDLIQGRQTEIDYFNGKIVDYGRKHYVRTSLNLAFTNMVKAMTNKNILSKVPGALGDASRKILDKGMVLKGGISFKNQNAFLGVDLGSAYTKFTVIDDKGTALFRYFLPTHGSDKEAFKQVMETVSTNFKIQYSCATGYGRKHFTQTDIVKTEINCAAAGVSLLYPGEKNIIDIGGEDIKIIRCDADNNVQNFYMNDKCAAGTGSFLSEICERTGMNISEMSGMAALSTYDKELNSFCTVFAKTEIMNWIFEGMKPEDIARGIYISIANRVSKMRLDPGIPTYMIGGVVAHHPFLRVLLNERFKMDITIVDAPQHVVSYGAAVMAMQSWNRRNAGKPEVKTEVIENE
jgi:2-dehydropantoate 2-reductase